MSIIQAHILYTGTVQGVGFRYAVIHAARKLALAGWVKNLPDGRVELCVEGPEDKIKTLRQNINDRFNGYIKNQAETIHPPAGKFQDFQIVF